MSVGSWPPSSETEDSTPASQGLIEPLSERELDVLRLLGTDLDGPDIARELVVSLNTVRTHTKNIYAKLGVNNRRAAVRRAGELDLPRPATTNPGVSSFATHRHRATASPVQRSWRVSRRRCGRFIGPASRAGWRRLR